MKRERPILFSTPMVQALLKGRKTQTRRTVKAHLDDRGLRFVNGWEDWHGVPIKYPYGQVGDMLWVREEHYVYGWWKKNGLTKGGRQKWQFVADPDMAHPPYFFNDSQYQDIKIKKNSYRDHGWYKRLARFMPRTYSRIWLEITDIRVERVQDIGEQDAFEEGAYDGKGPHGVGYLLFEELWVNINGVESWEANPFVWCLTFKVLSTTGRPDKP